MKKLFLPLFVLSLLASCSDGVRREVTLRNPTQRERIDEAFVLTRSDLNASQEDLLPALKGRKGEWIASQVDDMDGDGEWDELAFVCDIEAGATSTLSVEWVAPSDYPQFETRTNIRFAKLNDDEVLEEVVSESHDKENLACQGETLNYPYPYQMEGPAWENDKVGFRHYFDGRNCRDTFAKTTSKMVLDSVGIGEDGHPKNTYHEDNTDWGRDVLNVADAYGIGGLAFRYKDSLMLIGVPPKYKTDVVDLTTYNKVVEGVVRSVFTISYKGYNVAEYKIDIDSKITIWAGKYGYESEISTSKLPEGGALVTGMVANLNDMPYRDKDYEGKYISMSTHDKQTYVKRWYLGMSVILPIENFGEFFDAPKEGPSKILKSWCVELKPNAEGLYHYSSYTACELADPRFTKSEEFFAMIDEYAMNYVEPVEVLVK